MARGWVDGRRVAIRGGSAGRFSVLCALAFTTRFAAGINYCGVADLEALAQDTHKFESHHLDSLVAPLPEGRALYQQRSPVLHMGRRSKAAPSWKQPAPPAARWPAWSLKAKATASEKPTTCCVRCICN